MVGQTMVLWNNILFGIWQGDWHENDKDVGDVKSPFVDTFYHYYFNGVASSTKEH